MKLYCTFVDYSKAFDRINRNKLWSKLIGNGINGKILKGTSHDFCWSENPIYHLQKQGNILYISNQMTNPHKFAVIMKKNRVFGKFHS